MKQGITSSWYSGECIPGFEKFIPLILVLFICQCKAPADVSDTSWMTEEKYGLFMHYQYRIMLGYKTPALPDTSEMSAEQWNEFVNGFDVDEFADQMDKAKIGWVMFCLDDHFFAWPCSPNSRFNYYTGYEPGEKCSERDLILDLADALDKMGIKLIVYYAGLNGYMKEPQVIEGLKDTLRGQFNEDASMPVESCKRRLDILEEYADRFGTRIDGWWFDTPGQDNYDNKPYDWWKIDSIVHSSNPEALISFSHRNKFAPLVVGIDDFTGGDTYRKQDLKSLVPDSIPAQGGILWHGKIYCGDVYHGLGDSNLYSDEELIEWIETCNEQGGVCTLDWPFDPETGLIKDFGLQQMIRIKNAVKP